MTMASPRRPPYSAGDLVTGVTHVPPERRGRELPMQVSGRIVQVGSGWAGVDADKAYVWIRLASGREALALVKDIQKLPEQDARHRT
ncbi:hypothetical protein HYE82_33205 [Streptomyces sp. BR123]|uniref:hypothetical protein n=1 Tax=Streptomyces sp. BR123 TaxID=2749828 RepID=UPI0015C46554|nr:hypothetical protein [Streptomyces sp. BR123]NXY99153.1 hypothetical protein [Streptomyces sp. BR123]